MRCLGVCMFQARNERFLDALQGSQKNPKMMQTFSTKGTRSHTHTHTSDMLCSDDCSVQYALPLDSSPVSFPPSLSLPSAMSRLHSLQVQSNSAESSLILSNLSHITSVQPTQEWFIELAEETSLYQRYLQKRSQSTLRQKTIISLAHSHTSFLCSSVILLSLILHFLSAWTYWWTLIFKGQQILSPLLSLPLSFCILLLYLADTFWSAFLLSPVWLICLFALTFLSTSLFSVPCQLSLISSKKKCAVWLSASVHCTHVNVRGCAAKTNYLLLQS